MDNATLAPKMVASGPWRSVTQAAADSATDLPAVNNFAQNPNASYDFARVYFDIDFGGDANATVDLRFATGLDAAAADPAGAQEVKGWIVYPRLIQGILSTDVLASSETKQEHQAPDLTEGQYAIDVPVYGQNLWASVSDAAGYTYTSGWTVDARIVWYNRQADMR